MPVLIGLAKGSAGFLGLYLVIKILDFSINGKCNFVFGPDITWESYLFWVEIILQAILPLIIFLQPNLRNRVGWLMMGTSSAAVGMIMHRLNTGVIGYFRSSNSIYIPNLGEFLLGFGLLSGAGLLFLLLVERFHVFDEPDPHAEGDGDVWTKTEAVTVFAGYRARRVLLTLIIVVPVVWITFKSQATGPFQPIPDSLSGTVIGADALRATLLIDGNRNGEAVTFTHKKHQEALVKEYAVKEEETCVKCHHLNLPGDNNTNCRACHKDMNLESALFSSENHKDRFKTPADYKTFLTQNLENPGENYQACFDCHQENMPGLKNYANTGFSHQAPGYKHAMHGSCQTCHRKREKDLTDPKDEGNCQFCHALDQSKELLARQ